VYNQTKEEVERFSRIQVRLEENERMVDKTLVSFGLEKQQLEQNWLILEEADIAATEWLSKYENVPLNPEEVITSEDVLSAQMFDLVAEDSAIEDSLYFLNRALEGGKLDMESFLKLYRSLSREQFLKRATCKKVFEAQHAKLLNGSTIVRSNW